MNQPCKNVDNFRTERKRKMKGVGWPFYIYKLSLNRQYSY